MSKQSDIPTWTKPDDAIHLIIDFETKAFRHAHSKSNDASSLRAAGRRLFKALVGRLPTEAEQALLNK